MTDPLRDELQTVLGSSYLLIRELGGGGMSRVFLAREGALDRDVVVKVLPPDMAAGVNTDRFAREIATAARLQQANIVPVLASGAGNGIPWYAMPFVEGESLRARLARGPLSEGEAVSVLRDVARALLYAHERGVVHRDIKPDNILLSGESAVVTDFGIAKAITAARAATDAPLTGALTQAGLSLGTPAYMAPEQITGEADADHRVDLYAFGCLAFELLAGTAPFQATTAQRLVAAHLSEAPPRLATRRPMVAPALDALVARCLAKSPADRPATARDVLDALEAATRSVTSGVTPSLAGRTRSLPVALVIWAAAFGATYVLAKAAVIGIGLPTWTVPVALVLAGLGLPTIVLTWYVQRTARRAPLATPTRTPGGTVGPSTMARLAVDMAPHLSWRRTWRVGRWAGGLVAGLLAVIFTLRLFGIGPAASLLAAGRLNADDRVLVADFASTTADTSLGGVMAQAMRTSIGQSRTVRLVSSGDMGAGLQKMALPTSTRLTDSVAIEFALRGGVPLVVTGRVTPVGSGFLLTTELRATSAPSVPLAELQRSAANAGELITTIDQLARDLRARIGESLTSVTRAPALEKARTASLPALTAYSRGVAVGDREGDFIGGIVQLEKAVAIDSTFASAWRKLAAYYYNAGRPSSFAYRAASRAYGMRDRLSGTERAEVEAYYLREVRPLEGLQVYRTTPELSRVNQVALLRGLGRFAEADSVIRASTASEDVTIQIRTHTLGVALELGNVPAARVALDKLNEMAPGAFYAVLGQIYLGWVTGGVDSAAAVGATLARGTTQTARANGLALLQAAVGARGQLRQYDAMLPAVRATADSAGTYPILDEDVVRMIVTTAVLRRTETAGLARLDSMTKAKPPASVDRLDGYGPMLAAAYAQLGRADRAAALMADAERGATLEERQMLSAGRHIAMGEIALAQGKSAEALRLFRVATSADSGNFEPSWNARAPLREARTYDRMGDTAKAIAAYEQASTTRAGESFRDAPLGLPVALRRLGELYEATGDVARAIARYEAFVTLWKNADADLQPQVAEIRQRLTRLHAREARAR